MLKTDTFERVSTLGAKHIAYSRGRLLLANRLFMKHKQHMLPALRAIAELDAAFSMAKLYKEHLNTNAPFAFVEFVNSNKPVIEFHGAWMPFFGDKDPVQNNILLGGTHSQEHWLLTGPNGGGKSALIKNGIGQMICLAQSWGMVPAQKARMSLINGLRTSTSAKEDMRNGISTFMAQSKSMQRLADYINTEIKLDGNYLIIADEPYRGCVNDETARRTGAFCDLVVNKPNIACIIATHIKPVYAPTTEAKFNYYHVEIAEPTIGEFVRTYKLAPGLCNWWFNDVKRRSRYVDWINTINVSVDHE
jgi:DNA mismatch repair ATPase MutS